MSLSRFIFFVCIFISSFLLFFLQPMMAKTLLPWYGGSPAVWNTCMVFFQTSLLLGYMYAGRIIHQTPFKALCIHAILMIVSFCFLPFHFTAPDNVNSPITSILYTLCIHMFMPFLLLACNGPLIQHLYYLRFKNTYSAYPLYALSNAGSLLGLLGYPLVIENLYPLKDQYQIFFYLFILFCVCLFFCRPLNTPEISHLQEGKSSDMPDLATKLNWAVSALIPSSLLLGVTSHISFNFGSFPLFWVIPLSLYLLTFIWLFSKTRHTTLQIVQKIFPYLLILTALSSYFEIGAREWIFIPIHLIFFTTATLQIHGRLALTKPHESHLTVFYLWISIGGMLGGFFNSFLAPVIFNHVYEYPLMIALSCFFLNTPKPFTRVDFIKAVTLPLYFLMIYICTSILPEFTIPEVFLFWGAIPSLILFISKNNFYALPIAFFTFTLCVHTYMSSMQGHTVGQLRNFFGIKSIVESLDPPFRILFYGDTNHGMHPLSFKTRKPETLGYYHANSPFKDVFSFLHQTQGIKCIGVIGLGIGSMSAYLKSSDHLIYYEIDPEVVELAQNQNWFQYLSTTDGHIQLKVNDGRLGIARENTQFDLIILDAFNSDAIPFHLLTVEALRTYAHKLTPTGIIALHITNRYYDLESLLSANNELLKFNACVIWDEKFNPEDRAQIPSHWAVLSPYQSLEYFTRTKSWDTLLENCESKPAWTDEKTPLLPYFKWQ